MFGKVKLNVKLNRHLSSVEGFLFIVLECCRAMAMDEVPQIRQDFEEMLRTLERKSH